METKVSIRTILLGLMLSMFSAGASHAQWATPDENTHTCVSTPAQLSQRADMVAWVESFQDPAGKKGLEAFSGTWRFKHILAPTTLISFLYDENGFYAQVNNDPAEKVSLCLDQPDSPWLRVAAHEPACPELKNFYVSPADIGKIKLRAYTTLKAPNGTVEFRKISDETLRPEIPRPAPVCAMKAMQSNIINGAH